MKVSELQTETTWQFNNGATGRRMKVSELQTETTWLLNNAELRVEEWKPKPDLETPTSTSRELKGTVQNVRGLGVEEGEATPKTGGVRLTGAELPFHIIFWPIFLGKNIIFKHFSIEFFFVVKYDWNYLYFFAYVLEAS